MGVLDGRALIFVRTEALTTESLDAIAHAMERTSVNRPAGALAIVPGEAGLSSEELLARQRRIFQQAKKLEDVWVAFCVHGEGVQSMVMRAVVRMFVLGQPRMTMHAKPESAIVWFATKLGLSGEAVRSAVASLRSAGA